MGGAMRWFKGLFSTKKSLVSGVVSLKGSSGNSGYCTLPSDTICLRTFPTDSEKEQNKHAIAVATATATAAEAAVTAAKAAAVVVRLTGEGRAGSIIITRDEHWAALKIQKVFRGSLARKALRALKGIVKLQAIVRGYLVRKRAAAMLKSIQTLIRVQNAMRSKRNRRNKKEYSDLSQPRLSLDKFDEVAHDERRSKIAEVDDIFKKRSKSRQKHNVGAMSEYEDGFAYQGSDLELNLPKEKWNYATAHSTPRLSSSSKFATAHNTPRLSSSSHHNTANNRYYVMPSPCRSVCGNASCYGMNTPGYMENTQSFKAKVRSHSAPHQRAERKRLSLDEVITSRSSVSGESLLQQQQQRYSCS